MMKIPSDKPKSATNFDSDLAKILAANRSNVVTPHFASLTKLNTNDQRLRELAKIIMMKMVNDFNNSDQAKQARIVIHDDQAIEVRYLNVDNLLMGVWASVSLIILRLSLTEQLLIIDTLYPKAIRLSAKKFAVTFTVQTDPKSSTTPSVKTDPAIVDKLDSLLAGVAMLLVEMDEGGYPKPHPDKIEQQKMLIEQIIKEKRRAFKHKQDLERAYERDRHRDRSQGI